MMISTLLKSKHKCYFLIKTTKSDLEAVKKDLKTIITTQMNNNRFTSKFKNNKNKIISKKSPHVSFFRK